MALGNVGNPVPPVTTAKEGTAARMIEVARSQVGVIEGPKDNETLYGAFTGIALGAGGYGNSTNECNGE